MVNFVMCIYHNQNLKRGYLAKESTEDTRLTKALVVQEKLRMRLFGKQWKPRSQGSKRVCAPSPTRHPRGFHGSLLLATWKESRNLRAYFYHLVVG